MDNPMNDEQRNNRNDLLNNLPKSRGWSKPGVTLYQGCWIRSNFVQNVVAFQHQFQAQQQDIVLASHPKSGATWLKALVFSIVNRHRHAPTESPLLTMNPHTLVPFFEFSHAASRALIRSPAPRLIATHIAHALLPESVADKARIVYICRNPLDVIASYWKFLSGGHPDCYGKGWSLEDCVETFCRGKSSFGPFWENFLGFWRASLEAPEKVLFLTYEDMLEDSASHVKRIAEFLGFPFSEEEMRSGVVEGILELCRFKFLKELDVNKHGKSNVTSGLELKLFFRKGEVGDWVNHLTPSMVESVKNVIEEKFHGCGLTFKYKL